MAHAYSIQGALQLQEQVVECVQSIPTSFCKALAGRMPLSGGETPAMAKNRKLNQPSLAQFHSCRVCSTDVTT